MLITTYQPDPNTADAALDALRALAHYLDPTREPLSTAEGVRGFTARLRGAIDELTSGYADVFDRMGAIGHQSVSLADGYRRIALKRALFDPSQPPGFHAQQARRRIVEIIDGYLSRPG